MSPAQLYNESRLAELIVYVSERCENDRHFGTVKLNKILFYSDFVSYATRGSSITGETYIKDRLGPVPMHGREVKSRLEDEKAIAIREETKTTGRWSKEKRTIALRESKLGHFTGEDIAIVNDVIEGLRDATGADVTAFSHQLCGWQVTRMKDQIPYYSVFIPEEPLSLSPGETEWARSAAAQLG